MQKRITLRTVLEHLQAFRTSMEGRANVMEGRMDRLDKGLKEVKDELTAAKTRGEQTRSFLTMQLDNINDRLNDIEITMANQKHEKRIRRLEKFAGFAHS